MARSSQRMRLLYLAKIFWEYTDDEHGITMEEILVELEKYGIDAKCRAIYEDIAALKQFGFDIIRIKEDRTFYYSIGNREFELAELKLLVDSVQVSKFITERKSLQLIKKIESLCSKYERKQLHRQVCISGCLKTDNEKIYYIVDQLYSAINQNSMIRFQYFQWDMTKEKVLRHDGAFYQVSPWSLIRDNENYYLIGYDGIENKMKHFRVDKIMNLSKTRDRREGREEFHKLDMPTYTKRIFSMYGGIEQRVRLRFDRELAGVVIDRFGRDVTILKVDDSHFDVLVMVSVSEQFLGWLISLGKGVTVLDPEEVVEDLRRIAGDLTKRYGKEKKTT